MEIKRETKVYLRTTDGALMNTGCKYVFETKEGKSYCGKFVDIDRKGSICFESILSNKKSKHRFSIMPRSIVTIYEADIEVYDNVGGMEDE